VKNAIILLCLALIGLANSRAFGQAPALPAQFGPHSWTATVKVIGEDSSPISGAHISVQYDIPGKEGSGQPTYGELKGPTAAGGVFETLHTDRSLGLAIIVEKSGYYATRTGYQFYFLQTRQNPTFTLVLKKIGNPIAMYARHVRNGPPAFNEPIGYDLTVGDWVAPHGKGQTTDIIFTGKLDKKSKNDFDYKLTVSFPKPGDGIQEFVAPDVEKGGDLRSPHEAPADGYHLQVVRAMSRHPGKTSVEDLDLNRNYFFRVRTMLDSNGNVKSALYGKIYGDFMQFTYYLSATPNDRNVEFDPKHNLLSLKFREPQVRMP
jgi:hypothetical protein